MKDTQRPRPRSLSITRRHLIKQLAAASAGASGLLAVCRSVSTATNSGAAPSGSLAMGVAADPVSMDPRTSIVQSGFAMLRHVYDPLVFRDNQMKLVPVLAESWSNPDAKTLELKLRQGVKFQNGEDFDGQSVKYTIESILNYKDNKWVNSQFADYIAAINQVEVVDPFTVRLHTKQHSNALIQNLALIGMLPPKAGAAAGENFTNTPIGTGPYKVTEYVSNSRMVIEAFDQFWGTKPKAKTITFRILPEDATRLAALQSGEVQLINNLPVDAIPQLKGNANFQVLSIPSSRLIFVGFWDDKKPFDDPRVREAINYALDKDSIIKYLLAGAAKEATGPMSPAVPDYNEALSTPWPYDPKKAKDLLAQAGLGSGFKIRFGYPTGRYLMDKQVGDAIVGQLQAVGIQVEPQTAEWGTFYNNRSQGQYDAWLYGFGDVTMGPDFALQWFYRSPAAGGNYKNAQVSQLLSQADQAEDPQKSADLYKQAQKIIWDDAAWGWLYYQPDMYGASSKLQGFAPRVDEYFLLFNATLSK